MILANNFLVVSWRLFDYSYNIFFLYYFQVGLWWCRRVWLCPSFCPFSRKSSSPPSSAATPWTLPSNTNGCSLESASSAKWPVVWCIWNLWSEQLANCYFCPRRIFPVFGSVHFWRWGLSQGLDDVPPVQLHLLVLRTVRLLHVLPPLCCCCYLLCKSIQI